MNAQFEAELDRLLRKGYRVLSQTPGAAQLVKPKRFSFGVFLFLCLFGIFPGFVYWGWYAAKREDAIYLRAADNGVLRVTEPWLSNRLVVGLAIFVAVFLLLSATRYW